MEQEEFAKLHVGDWVYVHTKATPKSDHIGRVQIEKIYNDERKHGATCRYDANGDKWAEMGWKRGFFRREQMELTPNPKPKQDVYVWMCHETGEWAETRKAATEKFSVSASLLQSSNRYGTPINGRHYYRTLLKGGIPKRLEI